MDNGRCDDESVGGIARKISKIDRPECNVSRERQLGDTPCRTCSRIRAAESSDLKRPFATRSAISQKLMALIASWS